MVNLQKRNQCIGIRIIMERGGEHATSIVGMGA